MRSTRGQATVELVAVIPLLLLALAAGGQACLAASAAVEAIDAARAGARAAAVGASAVATARAALPSRLAGTALITVRRGVAVRVRVPAVVPGIGLEVEGWAG